MRTTRVQRRQPWLALSILALLVFYASWADPQRPLALDQRYYVYFASRIADGAVPHRDMFDNKPQLASVVGAAFVRLGDALDVDRVRTVRLGTLALGAITGLLAFAAVRALEGGDDVAGLLAVLCWTACPILGFQLSIGPVPKLLMTTLGLGAALLTVRGAWFLAGLLGGGAATDWQMGALAGLGVLLAAACEPRRRWRAIARVVAGGTAALVATVLALAASGALRAAFEQVVVASLARGASSRAQDLAPAGERALLMLRQSGAAPLWLVALAFAGAVVVASAAWRRRGQPEGRLALVFATLGFGVVAFTFVDFQAYGDLFALVSQLALLAGAGAGAIVHRLRATASRIAAGRRPGLAQAAVSTAAVAALAVAAHPWTPAPLHVDPGFQSLRAGATLDDQRSMASTLAARLAGRRVGFAGCSEYLSLARIETAVPFVFWNAAVHRQMRRSSDEPEGETFARVADEARLEVVVCPPERLVGTLVARGWRRSVVRAPASDYSLTLLERPETSGGAAQ